MVLCIAVLLAAATSGAAIGKGADRVAQSPPASQAGSPQPPPESQVRLLGPVVVPRIFRLTTFLPTFAPRAGGTTIAFGLTQVAQVGIQFAAVVPGRFFRGACRPNFAVLQRFPLCPRLVYTGVTLVTALRRGIHRLRFGGFVARGTFLRPGLYAVRVLARNATGIARTRFVTFRLFPPG